MLESIEKIIDDALSKLEGKWNKWQPMPSPKNCRKIDGPKKAGVYQIINKKTEKLVLFGNGKKCQQSMKSLFPEPHGVKGRNNKDKRNYILENWVNLEYRTMETSCKEEAEVIEGLLKAKRNHCFNT